MPDIYTLGASRVTDPEGNSIPPVCKVTYEIDPETDTREDWGELPLMFGLGLTALPAPPDDKGWAEGFCVEGGIYSATCVGARDVRSADVVGELKPGETALHSTGSDKTKRSRVFCKENTLALLVGNDTGLIVDRENGTISIMLKGKVRMQIKDSDDSIVAVAKSGKAWLEIKNDRVNAVGKVTNGGAASGPLALATQLATAITAANVTLLGTPEPVNGTVVAAALTAIAKALGGAAATKLTTGT